MSFIIISKQFTIRRIESEYLASDSILYVLCKNEDKFVFEAESVNVPFENPPLIDTYENLVSSLKEIKDNLESHISLWQNAYIAEILGILKENQSLPFKIVRAINEIKQ